jgi:hypothetical protein
MREKDVVARKSYLSQVIFILIILYAVSSITVLLLIRPILQRIPGSFLEFNSLIAYAIISFVVTLILGVFHLSTMVRNRKRRTDSNGTT